MINPLVEASLMKLSLPELKQRAKDAGVAHSGTKADLIKRIARPEEYQKGKKKDKNAPKRALSAYMFFAAEERGSSQYSHLMPSEVMKAIGAAWQELRPSQRERYQQQADMDKARYETEMKAYQPGYKPAVRKVAAQKPKKPKKAAPLTSYGSGPFDDSDRESDDESGDDSVLFGGVRSYCENCGMKGFIDPHNGFCEDCAEENRPAGGCPCWRQACKYISDEDMYECEF